MYDQVCFSRSDWAIRTQQVGLFKASSEKAAGDGPEEGEDRAEMEDRREAGDASSDTHRSGYLL